MLAPLPRWQGARWITRMSHVPASAPMAQGAVDWTNVALRSLAPKARGGTKKTNGWAVTPSPRRLGTPRRKPASHVRAPATEGEGTRLRETNAARSRPGLGGEGRHGEGETTSRSRPRPVGEGGVRKETRVPSPSNGEGQREEGIECRAPSLSMARGARNQAHGEHRHLRTSGKGEGVEEKRPPPHAGPSPPTAAPR